MDRRVFLGAGMAGAAALTFSSVWSQSTPQAGPPTLPEVGFRRMKLGNMELIALNDGAVRRPLGEEFVRNVPLEQVRSLLSSQNLPTDFIEIPFNAFMVVSGNQRVLFDTGFNDNGGATTGRLVANMAAAGFKPEDITQVVISHFHGDHINGVRNKAGALVFPRARIHVPAPEWAFWMDDARMASAPQAMQPAFQGVRRVFNGIPAEQLNRFDPGADLLPGIQSVAAYGHTPGHTLFTVKSEGQGFAYLADLTNIPSLFARSPDWAVQFDMDAEMARQTRRRMFEMVVREKLVAGGYHFPFPAFGTVEPMGNGYQFRPVA